MVCGLFSSSILNLTSSALLRTTLFLIGGKDGRPVYLLVYVDDIILAGERNALAGVKHLLDERFNTNDLGNCTLFLDLSNDRTESGNFFRTDYLRRR